MKNLEKKITGKIGAIKRKEVTPKDSGIGKLFTQLKNDPSEQATYERLLGEYKNVLSSLEKN